MRRRWLAVLGAAVSLVVWFGVNRAGSGSRSAAAHVRTSPAPHGATTPSAPLARYKPKGCSYTVTLPDGVQAASMDAPATDDDPRPVHVHVAWAGDPSSSFAVNWKTGQDTSLTEVVYGTDRSKVDTADGAKDGVALQVGHTYVYGSGSVVFHDQTTRIHEVHACGLQPSTTYYYKAGGPGHWSAVYDVATGPAPGSARPFRFAVLGDARGEPEAFAEVERKIQNEAPDFQIFTGDAVSYGANQADWDAFFEAASGDFRVENAMARIPFMPVNGNHESLVINYFAEFALPGTVSPGEVADSGGGEWYSFSYGNAHFLMLDDQPTGSQLDEETSWIKDDLSRLDRHATPWVFAVHHKPMYTASAHAPDLAARETWQPLFDEYKVDFDLNGHNHVYERSLPIRGFQPGTQNGALAKADENGAPVDGSGTIYVVAGGAGAPLYNAGRAYFTAHAEKTRNYVIFDIDGRTLNYRAMRPDGSRIESFSYTK